MTIRSPTSRSEEGEDWPGRVICDLEYSARLAARREQLGNPEAPRNSGARRTASKQALLKAIEEAGGRW